MIHKYRHYRHYRHRSNQRNISKSAGQAIIIGGLLIVGGLIALGGPLSLIVIGSIFAAIGIGHCVSDKCSRLKF